MPQVYSIDFHADWQRRGVTITERRIGVAEYRDDDWREGYSEPEVSIGDVVVTLGKKVAKVEFRTKAIVSLHALGRRFQWGWNNSDAALIRDIVPLGDVDIATLPTDESYVLLGGWRARVLDAEMNGKRTARILCCRSWLGL